MKDALVGAAARCGRSESQTATRPARVAPGHGRHAQDLARRESHVPLSVTRRNAPTVVIIAEQDYDGLVETLHLLRSPANAARLADAIEESAALAAPVSGR